MYTQHRPSTRFNCSEWDWDADDPIIFDKVDKKVAVYVPHREQMDILDEDNWDEVIVPAYELDDLENAVQQAKAATVDVWLDGAPHMHIVHVCSVPKRYAIFFALSPLHTATVRP